MGHTREKTESCGKGIENISKNRYFFKECSNRSIADDSQNHPENNETDSTASRLNSLSELDVDIEWNEYVSEPERVQFCQEQVEQNIPLPVDNSNFLLESLVQEKYPTDRGHFADNFITNDVKRFILERGSCRPDGPFPKNDQDQNRSFSSAYCTITNTAGITVSVTRLYYSLKLDVAYCKPCWLFADRSNPKYHQGWSNGICDRRGLSRKIKDHFKSHIYTQILV